MSPLDSTFHKIGHWLTYVNDIPRLFMIYVAAMYALGLVAMLGRDYTVISDAWEAMLALLPFMIAIWYSMYVAEALESRNEGTLYALRIPAGIGAVGFLAYTLINAAKWLTPQQQAFTGKIGTAGQPTAFADATMWIVRRFANALYDYSSTPVPPILAGLLLGYVKDLTVNE